MSDINHKYFVFVFIPRFRVGSIVVFDDKFDFVWLNAIVLIAKDILDELLVFEINRDLISGSMLVWFCKNSVQEMHFRKRDFEIAN